MKLWRRIGRHRWVTTTIGVTAAEYLRFVGLTTHFTFEPADVYERGEADMPIIVAFWHGQHLLAPVGRKVTHRVKMLVSLHRDGEINAVAAERLGVGAIRGSGNHGRGFVHKAGVAAFQSMLDALADGCSIALSADVPKVARVAGLGIVKLAQASGRPIYPSAIATSRRIVLDNWDRSTINLPFGRGAGVAAEPVNVPADADDDALDAARRTLEERLNVATRCSNAMVGRRNGGA
jgi:lysophospholipid acyltransferase (LPLAT)-like uncharacterized protein